MKTDKKLETLVPSLELCRRIPAGAFEDSALVWRRNYLFPKEEWIVAKRDECTSLMTVIPAPTLAEILEALAEKCEPVTVTLWRTGQVAITAQDGDIDYEEVAEDAATAALRLYLEVRNEN